jgi:hypothetical protein
MSTARVNFASIAAGLSVRSQNGTWRIASELPAVRRRFCTAALQACEQ